jgi:hypothetical protein
VLEGLAARLLALGLEYKVLVLFLALSRQRVVATEFMTLVASPEATAEVVAVVVLGNPVVQAQVGRGMQGVLVLVLEILMAQEAAVGQALRV